MRRRIFPAIVVFIAALQALAGSSQRQKLLAELQNPPVVKTLGNGLQIVVRENHATSAASFFIFVRAGSLTEGEHLGSGLTHILEHVLAGGSTTKRTEAEVSAILGKIGGQTNAFTWKDHTAYYIDTISKHADIAIELLCDTVLHPAFDEKEFEREMKVVIRELEDNEDDPARVFYRTATENIFRVHPTRIPVIGYKNLVEKVTRQDLINYHKKLYAPDRMVFVAVGDFKAEDIVKKVGSIFESVPRAGPILFSYPEEPPQVTARSVRRKAKVNICYMRLDFRTVELTHPDLYPLDILSFILSNGESSRLVKKIRNEKQLVTSISTYSFTPAFDAGYFSITARARREKLEEAKREILKEVYSLREGLVSRKELEKAKLQKISELLFDMQKPHQQAVILGGDVISAHDPQFSFKYVKNIQNVTAEDVRRVARKYLRGNRLNETIFVPEGAAEKAGGAEVEEEKGAIGKFVLENGMRLIVKKNPNVPIVSAQAFFLGGLRFENESTNGFFNFYSRLLTRGNRRMSAQKISEFFDARGGSFGAGSGRNTFYLYFSVLKGDFEDALRILYHSLKEPTFPEDEIEKARSLILAGIKQRFDDPFSEAGYFFRKDLYRKSPYAMASAGEMETVSRFRRADFLRLHRKYCIANNMVLAVVGDVEPGRVKAAVERIFRNFPSGSKENFPTPAVNEPLAEPKKFVREVKKQNAIIMMGFPGMRLTDTKDTFPMAVLDAMISGVYLPRGWLHDQLRGRGLVYVVHAYNETMLEPGAFIIYARATPENIDKVVEIILANIEKVKKGEFKEEEIEKAKEICIIAEALSRQTNSEIAMQVALDELYGLGYNFSEKYPQHINQVTAEDIKRVARKYFGSYVLSITKPKADNED